MTNNDKKNVYVFLGVTALVVAASALWLTNAGINDDNIRTATRHSAHFAFLIYLVVLVTRPLQQLMRTSWTAVLLRNRRLVGVAFAATMTGHLGLIVFRFTSQAQLDFPGPNFIGYGAYVVFYLMLVTSFDAPKRAIGPRAWKILHRTGLIWAGVIFGLPRSLESLTDPDYLKFGIPFAIALIIRITAWQLSRRPGE